MHAVIALLLAATAALAQLPPGEPTLGPGCPRPAAECVDFVEICLGNVVQQYNLTTNPACTQAFECLIQGGQMLELICCSVPSLYFCQKTQGVDYAGLMAGVGVGSV